MLGLQATDEGIVSMPLSTSLSLSSYSPPPLEVLVEHVAPFLDRDTFNSLMRVSRTARMTLETKIPPWPAKLASRDHMCRIRCLIFSQDGTNLACGCTDGMIRIWDVWTGEQTPLQDWPGQAVVALAYSPNERILASASNGHTIKIWPLAVRHATVAVTNDVIGRCCTGKQSSVMSSGTPRNIHAGHVTCLVVSHDGSKLYSGHHHTELISVWDTSTGKCLKEIRGDSSDPVPCLRTSQDGRYLVTTCATKGLKIWSLETGRCIQKWEGKAYNTVRICSHDHVMGAGTIKEEKESFLQIASIETQKTFSVWKASFDSSTSAVALTSSRRFKRFENLSPYEIRFSSNGKKVASVDDFKAVKVWNTNNGTLVSSFEDASLFPIHEIAFAKNRTVAAVSRYHNAIHLFPS